MDVQNVTPTTPVEKKYIISNKMLSYRRETALQCIIAFAKSRKLELGDNILQTL